MHGVFGQSGAFVLGSRDMCGIVGYIGTQQAAPILVEGLKSLEYRGYDSAGIALAPGNGKFRVARASGKLANLQSKVDLDDPTAPGHRPHPLGHPRPAHRGERPPPPHADGQVVAVHNGIIENHLELRAELKAVGRPSAPRRTPSSSR